MSKQHRVVQEGVQHGGSRTPAATRSLSLVSAASTQPGAAAPAFHLTDAGNAEAFASLNARNLRFDHRRGLWLVWDKHRWRSDRDGQVRRLAKSAIRHRLKTATTIDDPDVRAKAVRWALGSESRQRLDALVTLAESEPPLSDAGEHWDAEGMTQAQCLFALTWLENGFNATKAYLQSHPGAAETTARFEGSRTLANPNVRAVIKKRLEEAWGPLEMMAEEAVGRLGGMSRADIGLLFNDQNKLLPVRKWPHWMRHAVKKVDGDAVTMVDPLAVLRLILELTGRLKNPVAQETDALGEALKKTLELARQAREAQPDE
jgi:phage terminase small subunit